MQNRMYTSLATVSTSAYRFGSGTLTFLGNNLYNLGASSVNAISYVMSPIFTPIERYMIGDLRTYLKNPMEYNLQLIEQARVNTSGFAMVNLGTIVGNLAVWLPQSQKDLEAVVNQLDKEKHGRTIHQSFSFLAGSSKFLLADTSPEARIHRPFLTNNLSPSGYDSKLIWGEVKRATTEAGQGSVRLRQMLSGVVFNVLAKRIFGIDSLPKNTFEVMECFEKDINEIIGFPFPSLFKFSPALRKKRSFYERFEKDVLDGQLDVILKNMKEEASPANKNLILAFLVYLIQKDHPKFSQDELASYLKKITKEEVETYFKTESMKMLPILLRPAITLIDLLVVCLSQLACNPELTEKLRVEIQKENIFNNDQDVNYDRLLKSMPILDAIYNETLRFDSTKAIPRYSQGEIKCGPVAVPAKTTIIIDYEGVHKSKLFGENPEVYDPTRFLPNNDQGQNEREAKSVNPPKLNEYPFVPFSAGTRRCPAMIITPRIFKLILVYLVEKFDLQPDKDKRDYLMFIPVDQTSERHTLKKLS